MKRKLLIFLLALGFACNASAAIKTLSDTELQSMVDFGWKASTLDAITDIPGDPGTQYDITWEALGGWSDIAIGIYGGNGLANGDTWEQTFYNPDYDYVTVYLFAQVDGWSYYQSPGVHVPAGGTQDFSWVIPGTTSLDSIGFKFGMDSGWMSRPEGDSGVIQVIVPEPATMLLLGLGGLFLRRKR